MSERVDVLFTADTSSEAETLAIAWALAEPRIEAYGVMAVLRGDGATWTVRLWVRWR